MKGVRLHALRHTHASALLAAGVPVANVSKRLGHRDPYTTAIYALPDTDQDVAATWDRLMIKKTTAEPGGAKWHNGNEREEHNPLKSKAS